MTFFRSLNFPAVLILGASLTTGTLCAQTAAGSTEAATELPGKVVEGIVARVNDQVITNSDYQRALQQLDADAKQQGVPAMEVEERKSNLLRELIDQQLLLSKGKELDITGETELIRQLDEIRKQNHLDSLEDLEKAAQQQGVSYEDFKASIRNNIITQEVVRDQVHISITPSEVANYFKEHESEFAQPESVRLSEILIPTGAAGTEPDAAQVASAQAKADEVEQKLRAGAKFEDLAKSVSVGPTAAQGGDLGEFRRGSGMLAKELEDKTFSLQSNQYTEPIRTKQGFVILEVTQHTPGGEASYATVRPRVEEALFMERMQPALREYLTKLREQAYVEIAPGYTDTGASPNEMRLTYSAYVPPAVKKKKHFERKRFRGKVRSAAPPLQTASTAAPASGTPAAAAATAGTAGSGSASATGATGTQVASNQSQNISNSGKREKIRFGQAPRESLPAGDAGVTQTADATNPDVRSLSPGAATDAAPEKTVKTRFSSRPRVRKVKQQAAATAAAAVPGPTADELAAQKVQNAPLGLTPASSQKKTKKKGEKTRYSEKPKAPEETPQPYMGNQQQTTQPSSPAPSAPATPQP